MTNSVEYVKWNASSIPVGLQIEWLIWITIFGKEDKNNKNQFIQMSNWD